MNISIKNCNNIDEGYMSIAEGALNIKYAINGTGKSTISKALEAFITNNDDKKKDLIPFKFVDDPDDHMLEVCGYEQIKRLAIFNEKYIQGKDADTFQMVQKIYAEFESQKQLTTWNNSWP